MSTELDVSTNDWLQIGSHQLDSRLIVGTGKYDTYELMADSLRESATHCITVAVRRERLYDQHGQNILDYRILLNWSVIKPLVFPAVKTTDRIV